MPNKRVLAKIKYESKPNRTYVLAQCMGGFMHCEEENYNALIRDERGISYFMDVNGFITAKDCIDYLKNECGSDMTVERME